MNFIRTDKLAFDPRPQMGRIFVDGFYQWLKHFSKDKEKLTGALSHIFILDCFYTAVQSDEIASITACTDGTTPPIKLDRKTICNSLGLFRGIIAYIMLKKHLMIYRYPFEFPQNTGSIEFVATAIKYRGKGAAAQLLEHVMNIMPYDEYILEVADTNTSAVRLYSKLGFSAFRRAPAPKNSGFNYFMYMRKR